MELYKLHLKHHHMTSEQFRKRASALQIPTHIYDKYNELVKTCSTCQQRVRAPTRAKVSGMRSEVFGELTFVDHGEIALRDTPTKLVFLVLYDAATHLCTAIVVPSLDGETTRTHMREYFDTYQLNPRALVGDQAFMGEDFERFYNRHDIRPLATGPGTPWPNRAESAVRLLKNQIKLMLESIHDGTAPAVLMIVSYQELVKHACLARTSSVTFGGVTPFEVAFGRSPKDVLSLKPAARPAHRKRL